MKKIIKMLVVFLLVFVLTGCAGHLNKTTTKVTTESTKIKNMETSTSSMTQATTTSERSENQKKDRIDELIETMTLDEKIGQLFFVRVPEVNQVEDVKNYHLGGYILFGRDYENQTPETVKKNIASYQEAAKIPLLIGSDEEGGSVSRLSRAPGFLETPFASPQELYKTGGMPAVLADVESKSAILKSYGINVNLAPVADVSTVPNSFIYDRTIGLDAQGTADYVEQVVKKMHESKMGDTLKHFPGYGDNQDSHVTIVHDSRTLSELEKSDFLPFKAGIAAGTDSILVSHNIIESVDPTLPASISPKINQLLRNQLGFDGVVMTDDLDMAGIADFTGQNEAALAALKAGNDLVLTSTYATQIPYIKTAIEKGSWTEAELDQSVKRVLLWKEKLGLIP